MSDKQPIIQLNGWQTIKHYADSKGTTPNIVSVWVQRGKVESIKYPELNNLVLVKEKNK